MQAKTINVGPITAAVGNQVCASQTPLAAGALTIGGAGASNGVATFTGSSSRQVTITSGGGNESNKTFVVTGTGPNDEVISETIIGPGAGLTVTTVAYFKTVTSVTVSAATAGAVTVGMTNTGSSSWVRFDDFAPSNISIQCVVSGSSTYSVQSTLDDPNDPVYPVSIASMSWVDSSDAAVVAATTTKQSNFLFAPKYARLVVTTTSTGSVRGTFLQSSNGPI